MARVSLPFDRQCDLAGLPKPEPEWAFAKSLGRRWRFDWAWIGHGIALEVEGGVWTGGRHIRGSGFLADAVKYNIAAILGWRILRVTPKQIHDGTALTLVDRIIRGVPIAIIGSGNQGATAERAVATRRSAAQECSSSSSSPRPTSATRKLDQCSLLLSSGRPRRHEARRKRS